MAEFRKSYRADVGLNHVPAYQVSGRPFATGSVDVTTATKVDFPYLTRWFQVVNKAATPVNVGFSKIGVTNDPAGGTNFIAVDASGSLGYGKSEVYDIKIAELWLSGSDSVDVLAGLTTVPIERATTATGVSFSGSVGVG
jgi:hypothetical protein|tara:strand:- start:367 stop:786 length:420 start_codon:yes stop_codon:yes gene_type:complete